jgi:hypothetical protein
LVQAVVKHALATAFQKDKPISFKTLILLYD